MPMVDGYLDCQKKKDKGSINFVLQLITNNYKQPVTHKEQLQDVFFVQGAWHSQFTRNVVLRTRCVSIGRKISRIIFECSPMERI